MNRKAYLMEGKSSSLLWDEETDAWTYYSNDPRAESRETKTLYRAVPTIFRGVSLIANAVGKMPFTIFNLGGDVIFDQSTDYQNKLDFLPSPKRTFGLVSMSLDLTGTAYLRPLRNIAEFTKELAYYAPTTIEPRYDQLTGDLTFIRTANNKQTTLTAEELLYFWLSDAYVENQPPEAYPVRAALIAGGVLKNLGSYVTLYFERGAVRPVIVTVSGNPGEDQRKMLSNWFNRLMGGIKRGFRWRVFPAGGVDIKQVGDGLDSLRDNDLTTGQQRDVAVALGIPETILFSSSANYATSLSDTRNFFEQVVVPRSELIAEVFNEQLLNDLGYRIVFNPNTLDAFQEDEAQRSEAIARYVGSGTPLLMAMDLLGVELTDEQRAELEQLEDEESEEPITILPADVADLTPTIPQSAAMRSDLAKWERKALRLLEAGEGAACEFVSDAIAADEAMRISESLKGAQSIDDVKAVFDGFTILTAVEHTSEPTTPDQLLQALKYSVDAMKYGEVE